MKKSTLIALAVVLLMPAVAYTVAPPSNAARVERGRYIVHSFGCIDCHSPWKMGPNGPEPDAARLLSGHPADVELPPAPAAEGPWIVSASATNTAWKGPWGTSFTANLTPDDETGLGKWSEEDFIATIKSGRHLGRGREILPPMPIRMIKNMTDEDLASIYAYLQSIPAISNQVPNPLPPTAR